MYPPRPSGAFSDDLAASCPFPRLSPPARREGDDAAREAGGVVAPVASPTAMCTTAASRVAFTGVVWGVSLKLKHLEGVVLVRQGAPPRAVPTARSARCRAPACPLVARAPAIFVPFPSCPWSVVDVPRSGMSLVRPRETLVGGFAGNEARNLAPKMRRAGVHSLLRAL